MVLIYLSLLFQTPNYGWDLLSSVEINKEYDEFVGSEIEKPIFSASIRALEGQIVVLDGFMIPLGNEVSQDYFVLSRFPYQSCFFCGGAGPETVAEVFSDVEFAFTEKRIRVEGELELNDQNPYQLFFVLKNSKITRP